jgi:GT2 family glycosyltransferase
MQTAACSAMPGSQREDASGLPAVAIVILNWNDGAATLGCLAALQATTYPNRTVIVVDNASTDGSAQRIAALGSAEILFNATNLGFTGGVNAGIRHAMASGADYVWLLNSDAIPHPDVLSKLVAVAEADQRIGLVSPVFHDPDRPDVPDVCLARFDPAARYATQTADPATAQDWQDNHPNEVLLLGTALLIRRGLVEAIGVLDPAFFAYVEDVDYSLRSLAAGFRNVAVPDAVVLHRFKQPVANPDSVPAYLHYFITRNYLLLWRKLPGSVLMRKAALWYLRQRVVQLVRMQGHQAATDAVLAGLWDGVRGIGGPYQPAHKAPWLLRVVLGHHPAVWLRLIDGNRRNGQPAA